MLGSAGRLLRYIRSGRSPVDMQAYLTDGILHGTDVTRHLPGVDVSPSIRDQGDHIAVIVALDVAVPIAAPEGEDNPALDGGCDTVGPIGCAVHRGQDLLGSVNRA